jgi:hypothetical protein
LADVANGGGIEPSLGKELSRRVDDSLAFGI